MQKSNLAMHINLKILLSFSFISLLAITQGCRQDSSFFEAYEASIDDIRQTLLQVPDPLTHTVFKLDGLAKDTVLSTPGGVRISLVDTDHLFRSDNGATVALSTCSNLQLDVTEVVRKGDILARSLPTNTTTGTPLEAIAMVNIQLLCNGIPLRLLADRYIKIQIPAPDLKPNLSVWEGVSDTNTLQGWQTAIQGSTVEFADWQAGTGTATGYELIVKTMGWLSPSRPINDPTTSFCTTLPKGYDAENSQVFLVLNNNKSVFQLKPGSQANEFCADQVPVGYPVQVIAITKLGDYFQLGTHQTEVGTNTGVNVQPETISESEVLQFIKNL